MKYLCLLLVSVALSQSLIKNFRRSFFQFKAKESGYKNVKLFAECPAEGIIPLQYIYLSSNGKDDKNRFNPPPNRRAGILAKSSNSKSLVLYEYDYGQGLFVKKPEREFHTEHEILMAYYCMD